MNSIAQPSRNLSIFDKYGGIRILRHVIMDYYDRVLDSDVIGHFFEDTDMVKLIDHQTKFFTMVLGGPAHFSDARLASAHKHMRLSHVEFDEAVLLLNETLADAHFAQDDQNTVIAAIEARRRILVA
ncbi:group I truncated hemoglobin [Sulfitobacter sp. JL08]|uniref:group I truncated hemoglobin n=1 Tax=Sulfitobacter sp. JL08 TaxID=2070369 RepID=UPI0013B37429|nr:group 1 truncated hemoglobin [Sulfitobacter sp. JL08]